MDLPLLGISGRDMNYRAIIVELERADHRLSRSTVGAHLKALVEEEKKLDSTGDGRNAWYWRREEASD